MRLARGYARWSTYIETLLRRDTYIETLLRRDIRPVYICFLGQPLLANRARDARFRGDHTCITRGGAS